MATITARAPTIGAVSRAARRSYSAVLEVPSVPLLEAASYTSGDQSPPCAILWTDPDRLWEDVLGDLKPNVPELFVYGTYSPGERTGPAVWLRCVESRAVDARLSNDDVPIFYLPGVSKQKLREVEECSADLQPVVEYQFRGTIWVHPNGKDWTPLAFLSSDLGGLGLEVVKDAATSNALLRALAQLLRKRLLIFVTKDWIPIFLTDS
jgi:hypothetical protein